MAVVDVLKYVLGLDTKQLQTGARTAERTVNNMSNQMVTSIGRIATAFGGMYAAHKALQMAKQLGEFASVMTLTAARTEELQVIMESVGRVAGYSAGYLAQQEKVVKKLGITTQTSRMVLIRFMQAQIDLSYATKIARVAQDLAPIALMDTARAAETLTRAIAAQRPILLRQFGIVTDLSEVYGKLAKRLDKSAEDLNENEKRMAFLNIILEQGARVAGTYEAAMETVGKQMRSIPRYSQEAANAVGKVFMPVFKEMVKDITQGFKDIEKAFTENQEAIKKWQATIVAAYRPVTWMLLLTKLGIKGVIEHISILKKGLLDLPIEAFKKLMGIRDAIVYGPPKPPSSIEIPPPKTEKAKKALDGLYAYHSDITEGMARHTMFIGDYLLQRKQEQYEREVELAKEKWAREIAQQEEMLDVMLTGYDSFFDSLINRNLSVTEALKMAWQDLTKSILGYGVDLVKQDIKNALLRKTTEAGVQKTKLAAIASGSAKAIAWMAKEGAAALVLAAKAIYSAVAKIFSAHAGIPFIGVAIAGAFVGAMMATLGKFKKFAEGGLVGGLLAGQDQLLAALTKGEFVIPKPAVAAIGVPTLEHIKRTGEVPAVGGNVYIDMGGFVFTGAKKEDALAIKETVVDAVAEAVEEAIVTRKLEL